MDVEVQQPMTGWKEDQRSQNLTSEPLSPETWSSERLNVSTPTSRAGDSLVSMFKMFWPI
jgi:hypothetical protein